MLLCGRCLTVIICLSPAKLAIMFSIPFTAYGVGGFIGSVVTAPIIRLMGRRKAAIVSAFSTIVIYIGMAMACVVLNIYILTICKFFEGIFVRSLLSTIGEEIPYDIEDEEEMSCVIMNQYKKEKMFIL